MARITVNDVEAHYKPRPEQDLSVAISFSENFVTDVIVPANDVLAPEKKMGAGLLAFVQTLVAAGIASLINPPVSSGSGRNRTVQYEGDGKNRYFRDAAFFDQTGLVAKSFNATGPDKIASLTFISSAAEVA